MKVPFFDLSQATKQYAAELKAAACRVIDSGRFIGGNECAAFEKELAESIGVPYVVGVSNGLDALRLIFSALIHLGKLSKGDEVIVPANTYIASVLAVTDMGLKPIFVEPDPETLNIDSSKIEVAISERTHAILTVHLYGRAAYDETMRNVAAQHNLIIIEDNAQAIGADSATISPYNTTRTGSLGLAAAFSFYPTKNIGAIGDAGAVTTHDKDIADAVRALANYGSDTRYHNIYQGYNCRLDPIQAAILRVKLSHLESETVHRREIAAIYESNITTSYITKPRIGAPDLCVWHQYIVRTNHRDAFRKYLADNGIDTDIHYAVPPHRQPCYDAEYSALKLPITDALADTVVSLPIATISATDAQRVALIINDFRP